MWWLIDGPARLVGGLVGSLWIVIVVAAALGIAYAIYRVCQRRFGRNAGVAAAVLAGLYAGLVMYESGKWTAFALLEQRHSLDD